RSGGQAVLRGSPVYQLLTQPPQLLPFTYPPFAALLAVPIALIPWPVAQWVWVILVYAALLVAVCYAFRDLIRRAGRCSTAAGWGPTTAPPTSRSTACCSGSTGRTRSPRWYGPGAWSPWPTSGSGSPAGPPCCPIGCGTWTFACVARVHEGSACLPRTR